MLDSKFEKRLNILIKRLKEFLFQNKFDYTEFNYCEKHVINVKLNGKVQIIIECNSHITDDIYNNAIKNEIQYLCLNDSTEEIVYKECLKLIGIDYYAYILDIFEQCRSIEFPYPGYSDRELENSYKLLCKYKPDINSNEFPFNKRLGNKIILHFHKSMWKAYTENSISPYEAWKDDDLLKYIIKNRIIYKGHNLNVNHILGGLTVTRKAQRVSIFNSALAKYLVEKYLNEYNEVFDPFSGYSGRMLGVCSTNKKYIGQDISKIVIDEAIQIKNYFNLNAELYNRDSIKSSGNYECLFTCSPYSLKETWNAPLENKTCDEWIDICLNNYNCKKYLFIVDSTEKYEDKIVEEIQNKSHFNTNKEYIIILD